MKNEDFFWDVGQLPFIWSQLDSSEASDIPAALPFKLCVDKTTGVLRQFPDSSVQEALTLAYRKGSVLAGVVDESVASKPYVDDTIEFLLSSSPNKSLKDLSVLEIGSGTGYLLSVIKKNGARVLGVEPGQHGVSSGEKYNIEIINDFFPSEKIEGKFDIIILALVLEHFENPQKILSLIHPYLVNGGKVIITVPNEEPFLCAGDLSSLFHEHYSYFTKQSLTNTLNAGGFEVFEVEVGKRSGLLMASATVANGADVSNEKISFCIKEALSFKDLALVKAKNIQSFLEGHLSQDKSIGIYAPSRILNLLYLTGIPLERIRFFDDNPSIHGKFFPGFKQRIENRDDLMKNGSDIVLIFSKNFESKIKESLLSSGLDEGRVVTWSDLFGLF